MKNLKSFLKRNIFFFLGIILSISLLSCSSSDDDNHYEDEKGVSAIIKREGHEDYHFSYSSIGGAEPARFFGPSEDTGLYQVKMVFVEINPVKTISIIAYIDENPNVYYSSKETENLDEGFAGMSLKWNDDESEQKMYFNDQSTELQGSVILEIIEVQEHSIKGTFSGVLYTSEGEEAVVEDGKFNVKLNRDSVVN